MSKVQILTKCLSVFQDELINSIHKIGLTVEKIRLSKIKTQHK